MREQKQILKEVILNNKEGFTCDFKGKLINKENGFFIGITNIKGKQINRLIEKVLYIKKNGFKDNKNLFIGGWNDGKTFYLDLSLYVENKNFSCKIGKLFNQKAIFENSKLKEIYLK